MPLPIDKDYSSQNPSYKLIATSANQFNYSDEPQYTAGKQERKDYLI